MPLFFCLAVPGRHHAGGILGKVETWLPEGLPSHSLGLNEFWGDLEVAENPELEFQHMVQDLGILNVDKRTTVKNLDTFAFSDSGGYAFLSKRGPCQVPYMPDGTLQE